MCKSHSTRHETNHHPHKKGINLLIYILKYLEEVYSQNQITKVNQDEIPHFLHGY